MPRAAQINTSVGPLHGVGLFTGKRCSVTIRPSGDGGAGGVLFRRLLPGGHVDIPALLRHVTSDTAWSGLPKGVPVRNTTLAASPAAITTGACVATVEHLLSALAGLGVADALIEVEGPEVPILDGSALGFVEALKPTVSPGHGSGPTIVIRHEATVTDPSGAYIRASPGIGCSMTYRLDYGAGSPLPAQQATWDGSAEGFVHGIAPARTFSLLHEARAAQEMGLFKHLTPREMLVIGSDGRPVENTLRFSDEPARHKLLDLIGDLSLLGGRIEGKVVAYRSGHALAHELGRAILEAR